MFRDDNFRHLGGGRKGIFLLLRYLFIVAAAYLLIFDGRPGSHLAPQHALMIAVALASNVGLSLASERFVFAWYVEAPVLIADTLWVSWALQSTGTNGQELFLLYFFVLFLAALGENLVIVLAGSTAISVANVYFIADGPMWSSPHLLRVVFFYTVALFYGYVISQIKRERQRADRGFAWARDLEAKVAERTAQLAQLYSASLVANRLKTEFLANMSHELRTPLGIILGYTEMMLDKSFRPEPGERAHMLERIRDAAHQQARLVDAVLDLGRLESGKVPIDQQPVLLDRLLADFQQRPRPPLAAVQLCWRIAANLPVIESDPAKLNVVFEHLLDNALKFTESGRVTVSVRDLPEARQVEFRIDDTGPGISAHDLATIFEPFRQVDASSTRRHGGTGLGLAIVQRYVDLLGGTITVDSTLGSGSSFVIVLPYRPHDRLSALRTADQPPGEPQRRAAA